MDRQNILQQLVKARKAIKRKHFALKVGKESAENLARERLKPIINPLQRIIENIENKPINEPTIEKPKAIHFKEDTFYTGIDDDEEGEQGEQKSSTFVLPDESNIIASSSPSKVSYPSKANEYLMMISTKGEDKRMFDDKLGVRKLVSGYKIGDQFIDFEDSNFIIGNNKYNITNGLVELLALKFFFMSMCI